MSYLENLNPKQHEAVLTTEGALLVVAGAGSGKTKMLTSRIAYLMEVKHVPAYQILAVTFTNKAAAEMKERVKHYLISRLDSFSFGEPEIGTFHSVCLRILRREIQATPYDKPFVIYDDSDQLSLMKVVLDKLNIDDKVFSAKSLLAAINRLKCDAVEPHELEPEPYQVFEKTLKRVYEAYQNEMFLSSAIDFGEIICLTYRILRDHPEIRTKYQQRYRYIHVDEYQDTNRAQYLLLSLLTAPIHGGHGNLCVVGDEDQSIYKWRGADIHNILDYEKDYPEAKVIKLEQNYRSTQKIIEASHQVIHHNKSRRDKKLWTENAIGDPIQVIRLADERAEAEWVIRELKRLASQEGYSLKDFSIFYRTHAQSRPFEDCLRREKLNYQIVGGLKFYDRKEIKDILAYFKVLLNSSDSVSLKRIINTPTRGIGKTTIDELEKVQLTLGISLWDSLERAVQGQSDLGAGPLKKLKAFYGMMSQLRQKVPQMKLGSLQGEVTLTELYQAVLDQTEYVVVLKNEKTEEAAARIENLEEFNNVLEEFDEKYDEKFDENSADNNNDDNDSEEPEGNDYKPTSISIELTGFEDAPRNRLEQFLEETATVQERVQESLEVSDQPLSLMTLHGSKGLEFPVVFMVGMEEGLFPSVRPWEDSEEEEIEEERRLCYVGMTRAKQKLYMLSAAMRRIWGNIHYQDPARFLKEIHESHKLVRDFVGESTSEFDSESRSFFSKTSKSPYSQQKNAHLIGQEILHPDYGHGKIISSEGDGDACRVTIQFSRSGTKKFIYQYVRGYVC
jgi:DNA helicase-2/ATP-dependent DNA helicase PcrA